MTRPVINTADVDPDSGEFGVLAGLPAGSEGKPRRFVFVRRESDSLNYREGA